MPSPIQKAKRKQHTLVNILRDVFSQDTFFEFQTTYPLKWCIEYLEREARLSADRSYGPFAETPKSVVIHPDIVTFSLPVLFGDRRVSEGVCISGSLEGLNDGSTVIRGKITNDDFALQMVAVGLIGLFAIWVLRAVIDDPLWVLAGLGVAIVAIGHNSSTKRKGLQYIRSVLCPLDGR